MITKRSILGEIEEFLEYLAKSNEDSRKVESLKIKFGEERYKSIYDIIGGRYTGGLTKEEKGKKHLILYIQNEGLKFLEEQQKGRRQERKLDSQNKLTAGLFTLGFSQIAVSIIYNFLDLQTKGALLNSYIFLGGSIMGVVLFFIILLKSSSKF